MAAIHVIFGIFFVIISSRVFDHSPEPPCAVQDPEAQESTGIFVPSSQSHDNVFSHTFAQHESSGRRDWYEQRMAMSFANITTREVVWLVTYVSKAIAYLRSDT
jgi:hypothetical protein